MDLKNENFQIIKRSQTHGLVTTISPTEIADTDFSALQNMRFSRFGFGPRLGVDIVGSSDNTHTTGIKSLYCFGRADGVFILVRNATTFVEWYDTVNSKWQTLISGATSGLRYAYCPYNLSDLTSILPHLILSNGTQNFSEWNGSIGNILSTTANSITLTGSTTLANLGFAASGSLIINGTTYTYSSIANQTFSTVSGNPTGEANGSGVAQLPDTSTYSALPKGNILHSAMGRVWLSKDTAIRVAYSKAVDFTNFTSGNDYGDPGVEDFTEGDGPVMALTSKSVQGSNKVIVWKENGIYTQALEIYAATSATNAKRSVRGTIVEGPDTGCASPLAVACAKFGEYFASSRGGLHILGKTNSGDLQPIHLTSNILPTLKDFNFQQAAVGYDPNENLVYLACRGVDSAGQTAATNDTLIVYDIQRQGISQYKGLNLSCFAYDPKARKMYTGDSNQANVYEMNIAGKFSDDIGSGERAPIIASALTKRYDFGAPAQKKKFNLYMVQGLILPGAEIKVDFRYNSGTKKVLTRTIDGSIDNAYIFTKQSNTFGAFKFGDLAYGGEDTDALVDGMNPFLVYLKVPIALCFNIEILYYSLSEVSGFWINADGFSAMAEKTIDPSLIIGS